MEAKFTPIEGTFDGFCNIIVGTGILQGFWVQRGILLTIRVVRQIWKLFLVVAM